jgi:hypothetical protein
MPVELSAVRNGIDDGRDDVVRLGGYLQRVDQRRRSAKDDEAMAQCHGMGEGDGGERPATGLPALNRATVDREVLGDGVLAPRN